MDYNDIVELSFRGESVFTTIDTIVRSYQQNHDSSSITITFAFFTIQRLKMILVRI